MNAPFCCSFLPPCARPAEEVAERNSENLLRRFPGICLEVRQKPPPPLIYEEKCNVPNSPRDQSPAKKNRGEEKEDEEEEEEAVAQNSLPASAGEVLSE